MQRNANNDFDKIQSLIRGNQIRNQYQINQLADNQLVNYETYVVGNDPMMPDELAIYAERKSKIAVIGTSGLRTVSLACRLGNLEQPPKIFLVDNSSQVTSFWQEMRRFMQNNAKADTKELFLKNLPDFLFDHQHLYRYVDTDALKNHGNNKIKYVSQDIKCFFRGHV